MRVSGQLVEVTDFIMNLARAISPAEILHPVSTRTSLVVRALEVVHFNVEAVRNDIWEVLTAATEHWLFLVGELGRRMAHEGCRCNVVGTDRLWVRERKRRGD
jgi:hypothetical protein